VNRTSLLGNNSRFKRGRFKTNLVPVLIVCLSLATLGGCSVSSEKLEFSRAEQAQAKNDSKSALEHYRNVVNRYIKTPLAIQSAKQAARISHYQTKDAQEAIFFYRHIVLYSQDAGERFEAHKNIAELRFTKLLDYKQAIADYSQLLNLPHSSTDEFNFRMAIARCHFYLSDFFQAVTETNEIIEKKFDTELLFEAYLLKANALLSDKKPDEAILILNSLLEKYPARAKAENIGLVLAITYEEQKNFNKAIETLESLKNSYPRKGFIESRIKILRERQSYLPGARGWKK
jgi:tetratricopeptide (TPR) repeat protein